MNEGFKVNDFSHLEEAKRPGLEQKREANGWGFTREDLERHSVHMVTEVRLEWDDNTPPELRKAFAEGSHVLHHIAEKAIQRQLDFDGMKPTSQRETFLAHKENGEQVTLVDSGWELTE